MVSFPHSVRLTAIFSLAMSLGIVSVLMVHKFYIPFKVIVELNDLVIQPAELEGCKTDDISLIQWTGDLSDLKDSHAKFGIVNNRPQMIRFFVDTKRELDTESVHIILDSKFPPSDTGYIGPNLPTGLPIPVRSDDRPFSLFVHYTYHLVDPWHDELNQWQIMKVHFPRPDSLPDFCS